MHPFICPQRLQRPQRLQGRVVHTLLLTIGLILATPCHAGPIEQAQQYITSGELRSAVITLRRLIQENPKNIPAQRLLIDIYLDAGATEAARQQLDQLARLRIPQDRYRYLLGRVQLSERNLTAFDETTRIRDDMPPMLMAQMLLLKGLKAQQNDQFALAEKQLQRAIKLNPELFEAHLLLSRLSLTQGQYQAASTQLEQAQKLRHPCPSCLLQGAQIAIAQQQLNVAKHQLEQLLKLQAENPQAQLILSKIALQQQRIDDADKRLKPLEKRFPDNANIALLRAAVASQQNHLQEAGQAITRSLDKAPNQADALLLGTKLAYQGHDFGLAEQRLRHYLALRPENDSQQQLLLADILLKRGHHQESIDLLNALIAQNPDNSAAMALLGEALLRGGQTQDSVHWLRKAKRQQPNNPQIQQRLALSEAFNGDASAIDQIDTLKPNDKVAFKARLLLSKGDKNSAKAALKLIDHALESFSDAAAPDPQLSHVKALALMITGDNAAATTVLTNNIKQHPNYSPSRLSLATLLLNKPSPPQGTSDQAADRFSGVTQSTTGSQPKKVIALLADIPKDDPNASRAHLLRFAAHAQLGHIDAAIQSLEQALALEPQSQQLLTLKAQFLAANQRDQAALEAAKQLSQHHPDNLAGQQLLTALLLRNGKLKQAKETIERLSKRQPNNAQLLTTIARIELALGDINAAKQALQKALTIAPEQAQAIQLQAQLQIQEKDYLAALKSAQRLDTLLPQLAIGALIEARVHMLQHHAELAVPAYQKALQRNPSTAIVILLYRAQKKSLNSNALETLNSWLKQHPEDYAVAQIIATENGTNGKRHAAIKSYQRIIKAQPNNVIALNNLAMFAQMENQPEALHYAERAYQLAPNTIQVIDTYGWLLMENGQLQKAAKILQTGLKQSGNTSVLRYRYAAALAKAGDPKRAIKQLESLLITGQDFPEIGEATALLRTLQASSAGE